MCARTDQFLAAAAILPPRDPAIRAALAGSLIPCRAGGHLRRPPGGGKHAHQRLAAVATSPTLLGFHHYVGGEIHSAAGQREQAEARYTRAIELARSSGATFADGIAAVGLVTLRADTARIDQALHGYRDLIDYWERTGSWIQQWTTLRTSPDCCTPSATRAGAVLGGRGEVAADHAPDAAAMSDTARNQPWPPSAQHPAADRLAEVRSQASTCARARVLEVARQSIDHHSRQ